MLILIFFRLFTPGLSPRGYRDWCFVVAMCGLIVRTQNLEVTKQNASLLAGKNTEAALEIYPYSCFWWSGYSQGA